MTVAQLNALEWVAIGSWAIKTNCILTAAKVATHLNKKCRRSRQAGTFDGIEWMCLARFEQAVADQESP